MEIRELDPSDDSAMQGWHATYFAADAEGRDFATLWQLPEFLAEWRSGQTQFRRVLMGGYDAGTLVCAGALWADTLSNPRMAEVELFTHPEHRRRGHATAMLAHLEGVAAGWGRSVLLAESGWPSGLGPDGAGWPGVEFARARGYALELSNVQRRLDLPVDVAAFAGEVAAAYASGYRMQSFTGRIPDDVAEVWTALAATLDLEAPTGGLEIEAGSTSVAAMREREQVLAAQGRIRVHTIAWSEDGELAGYTEISVPTAEPGRAYQWDTLVAPAHRGHRLGLALKVANLEQLIREVPDRTHVVTYNAGANAHMIAINEQLGFRAVEFAGEFQKVTG